ncbi:LysR family transcriptional regulator [Humibacter sp. BT305]|nr:LysR family transcriptional regulator [Humibacter sp. BT305]
MTLVTTSAGAFELDSQTLRIVHAVATYGSITRAAAALGYSQPAVSQHLRRVETRMGMPLVTRVGRGIALTDAGEVVARHAGVVLSALDSASGELSELSGLHAGRVRLSGFPSASSTVVPSLLRTMADQHPGIEIGYVEAEPPESIAAVRDGSCDVAIAFAYPTDPADAFGRLTEGLAVTTLFRDDIVVLTPSDLEVNATSLGSLHDSTWIAGCPQCRGHLLDTCARAGFAPSIGYETDNAVAVMSMVAAGLGIAMLPALATTASPVPAGVTAHPTAGEHRLVVAVTRPDARALPAVDALLTALTALTAERPADRAA